LGLDQLNGPSGESAGPWADRVREVAARRAATHAAAEAADEEFNEVIRSAVSSKRIGVAAIAEAAGISRARVYQIHYSR
jgi:DNA-binding phage protein